MSQARTWIPNVICRVLCIQLLAVRDLKIVLHPSYPSCDLIIKITMTIFVMLITRHASFGTLNFLKVNWCLPSTSDLFICVELMAITV